MAAGVEGAEEREPLWRETGEGEQVPVFRRGRGVRVSSGRDPPRLCPGC